MAKAKSEVGNVAVTALEPINHDGVLYQADETIEGLSAVQAKALADSGAGRIVSEEKPAK